MRVLLDTHCFLWWRADHPNLPDEVRAAVADDRNEVFVSAAVGWEVVIKRALGKLDFDGTVAAAVAEEGFSSLSVALEHIDEVAELPLHHRDPFDRLLAAQARIEGLVLATVDSEILAYDGFDALPARC